MEPPLSSTELLVRKCANIKSRKSPDIQCNINATNGDFCSRHSKHPCRFSLKKVAPGPERATRKELEAITKIQRFWKKKSPLLSIRNQGIGIFQRANSVNETELYSFDPVASIPNLYYFSFTDDKKNLWSFDIRTLGQVLSNGDLKLNPYTRNPLVPSILGKIRSRLTWLRRRKYTVFYPAGTDLTQEQIWSQRILDLFMKIESFGYYVSCEWFTAMTIPDHIKFYKTLYELWNYRLGLTAFDRERIVPGHVNGPKTLFRYVPESFVGNRAHKKLWWERLNLALIESFLTRSVDKEQQKLGAMYCVMGLVAVNSAAAESFPWIAESLA